MKSDTNRFIYFFTAIHIRQIAKRWWYDSKIICKFYTYMSFCKNILLRILYFLRSTSPSCSRVVSQIKITRYFIKQYVRKNINRTLNLQKTSHISPSRVGYGMPIMRILGKIKARLCIRHVNTKLCKVCKPKSVSHRAVAHSNSQHAEA